MKTIIKRLILLILPFTILTLKNAMAQTVSQQWNKVVVIRSNQVRIDSLLENLSRQTGIEFSFNSRRISADKTITITHHTLTLKQWFQLLDQSLGVTYKTVGNHIILIDIEHKKSTPAAVAKKGSTPVFKQKTPSGESKKDGLPSPTTGPDTTTGKTKPGTKPIVTDSMSALQQASMSQVEQASQEVKTQRNNSPASTTIKDTAEKSIKEAVAATQQQSPGHDYTQDDHQKAFYFSGGYSRHGSGDMKGNYFGAGFMQYFTTKLSLNYYFRGTINSSKDVIIVTDVNSGTKTDASVRYTTAGFQSGVDGQFSFIHTQRHEVMIALGCFGRYQSASNGSDGYSLYYPATTGVPTILVGYDNKTPQETMSFGGLLQLHYHFTINKSLFFGVTTGFQTDTNGDAIPQAGITIGKRFNGRTL